MVAGSAITCSPTLNLPLGSLHPSTKAGVQSWGDEDLWGVARQEEASDQQWLEMPRLGLFEKMFEMTLGTDVELLMYFYSIWI